MWRAVPVLSVLLAGSLACAAIAQEEGDPAPEDLPAPQGADETLPEAGTGERPAATVAPGATIRWLDKIAGATGDIDLGRGQAGQTGRLTILLDDCRYPADGSPTDAYAHVTVTDSSMTDAVFSGWMLASAPALSAMDHSRYDVWVLRCLTE
jgi:hypothetical protein